MSDARHDEDAPERDAREDAQPEVKIRIGSRRRWQRVGWGLGTLLALAALVWLAVEVPAVSIPMLLAFILAYVLDPVVKLLAARGVPRTLAVVFILVLALLVVAGIAALLGPTVMRELADVPAKAEQILGRTLVWAEATFGVDLGDAREAVREFLREQSLDAGDVTAPAARVARAIYGGAIGTIGFVVGAIMTLVFTFFMLRGYGRVLESVRDLIPVRYRAFVGDRAREIDTAMSSFLRGQLTVATILAALYVTGFLIVGQPLAVAVGLIAGFGNVIPFVGTAIGVVLATGLILLEQPTWTMVLSSWAVFAVVQALEGWVITPKIVGESLDLSPFVVIVAVLVFGELFGFVGVLVAVPLTAVIKILGRVILEAYRESAFFNQEDKRDRPPAR